MYRGINFQEGINKIWNEEEALQEHSIRTFIKDVRGVEEEELIELDLADFKSNGMFYVYSDSLFTDIYGSTALEYQAGLYYNNEQCKYYRRVVMPMRDFDDRVIGFIGYSNQGDGSVKYLYPNKEFFDKSKYMYVEKDEFKQALDEQYICVVDGLFDKRRLTTLGINAVSLCGTQVTEYHKHYLSFIKNIIVVPDNDEAGNKFVKQLKYGLPNCNILRIQNSKAGDIDDALKTMEDAKEFQNMFNDMRAEGFLCDKVF